MYSWEQAKHLGSALHLRGLPGLSLSPIMPVASAQDVSILALGVVLAAAYLFRDQIFRSAPAKPVPPAPSKLVNGHGNPRDFIAKIKEGVSHPTYISPPSHIYPCISEKAHRHLLWLADRHSRGIRHSSGQRGEVEVWPHVPRLRSRRVRLRELGSDSTRYLRLLRRGYIRRG